MCEFGHGQSGGAGEEPSFLILMLAPENIKNVFSIKTLDCIKNYIMEDYVDYRYLKNLPQ